LRFPSARSEGPRNRGHYSDHSWRAIEGMSREKFSQNKLGAIKEGKNKFKLKHSAENRDNV